MRFAKAFLLIFVLGGLSVSCSNSDTENIPADTKDISSETTAITFGNRDIENLFQRAGEQYQAGNYKESIELYTQVIEKDPNIGLAYNNRAAAEVTLRRYDDALADFNKAIELMPENSGAYLGRGLTNILMFNEKAGCEDLEKAGELGHPDAKSAIEKHCKMGSSGQN